MRLIEQLLTNFDYSVEQWFESRASKQQLDFGLTLGSIRDRRNRHDSRVKRNRSIMSGLERFE
jgi:hypothetical protein